MKKSLVEKRKSYYGSPLRPESVARTETSRTTSKNALEKYQEAALRRLIKKPIVVQKNKAMMLRDQISKKTNKFVREAEMRVMFDVLNQMLGDGLDTFKLFLLNKMAYKIMKNKKF